MHPFRKVPQKPASTFARAEQFGIRSCPRNNAVSFLSLIFRFQGDNSQFQSKVRETEHSIDGLAGKLKSGLKAAGAALGLSEVFAKVKEGVEYASHLRDVQERLDTTAEATQRYANAARRSRLDVDEIASAFDKLRKNIGTAMGDDTAAVKMQAHFDELGVTMEDIKNKSFDEVFNMIMQAMASGSMTAEQFTAAAETLGKAYGKLIPFAKDLAQAHKDLLFTDSDLAQLKEAESRFSDLFNNIKVCAGKALLFVKEGFEKIADFGYGGINQVAQARFDKRKAAEEAEANHKQLEDQKAKAEAEAERARKEQEDILSGAKAHEAGMERAVRADEEADKINEANRMRALTQEEQINELLEKRAKLMETIRYHEQFKEHEAVSPNFAEEGAEARKMLAETNQQLLSIQHTTKLEKPNVDSLAKVGLFIGGKRDPLISISEQQLQETIRVRQVLDEIRRTKPKSIFD